jgi:hypothetical protein
MSRKLCVAGSRGPYSYVILDSETDVVVARVLGDDEETVTTHIDMEYAERWVDRRLQNLLGRKYETD